MEDHERNRKWDKRLIHFFWLGLLFNIIVTTFNIQYTDMSKINYLVENILIPTSLFLAVILYFEGSFRWNHEINDYGMIIGSNVILLTFMLAYESLISILIILFVFPIFFAVFTTKKRIITFAYIMATIIYWGLILFCPYYYFSISEHITFTFVLIVAYLLGIALTNHYRDLNNELIKSVKNEKELLYKKIFMERLAKVDLPTNLYNHKTFHEYLEKVMEQFIKRPFPLHVALLDLDSFKKINDSYGHSNGDLVIEKTAQIILENISDHDFASRYGGEEFGIIFIEKTQEECLEILEKIRASLEAHHFSEMSDASITLSIGLATEVGTMCKDVLFNKADKYLYQSKRNGKNQITFGTSD
jgi:diguanylate cyclase (GGDEF)-like protein